MPAIRRERHGRQERAGGFGGLQFQQVLDLRIEPVNDMGEAGGAVAGVEFKAAHCAAGAVGGFENDDPAAVLRQQRGRRQAIMAAADDDGIEVCSVEIRGPGEIR